MKTWLITDTHFYHDKPVMLNPRPDGCGRPENFTKLIIDNCQKLVAPEDVVIHLGDVIFSGASRLADIMDQLPGNWILVKGNHDGNSVDWYMNRGFVFACSSIVYKNVLLSHYPKKDLPDNCFVNVHGHFHNQPEEFWDVPTYPHCKLLAIENTNYCPVDFEEFTRAERPAGRIILP